MSRKKNKKPDQKRKKPIATFPAKFSVGNCVRVKPGTTVPDFTDIPLGGWAGRVSEVDQRSNPPTYSVEWNRYTLDHMHPVFRNRCERDGLTLESMWLAETDLELDNGEPAVIEQPTRIAIRPLTKNDQDDRIRAIFALTSNDPLPLANLENLRRYARYLKTQLSFPFQAKYFVETGPFQQSEYLVTVEGLLDADDCDEEGVLCEAKQHGEFFELALADLEVRRDRHNRQLIEDYSYWFGNWPAEEFTTSVMVHPLSVDGATTSAKVPPLPFNAEKDQLRPFLKALAECGLCGAFYGVVLGSLLGAVEGTLTGVLVGAAVLGLISLVIGTSFGRVAGVLNRSRHGSLIGGTFCLLVGVLVGALLGAMVVAFTGSLIGGIVGRLLGEFLAKWKRRGMTPLGGMVVGAGVGAVVLACCRDQETALQWAVHGAWVGGGSAVVLLLGIGVFLTQILRAPRGHVED